MPTSRWDVGASSRTDPILGGITRKQSSQLAQNVACLVGSASSLLHLSSSTCTHAFVMRISEPHNCIRWQCPQETRHWDAAQWNNNNPIGCRGISWCSVTCPDVVPQNPVAEMKQQRTPPHVMQESALLPFPPANLVPVWANKSFLSGLALEPMLSVGRRRKTTTWYSDCAQHFPENRQHRRFTTEHPHERNGFLANSCHNLTRLLLPGLSSSNPAMRAPHTRNLLWSNQLCLDMPTVESRPWRQCLLLFVNLLGE